MTRRLGWTDLAWEDYLYWQGQDRKTLRRINQLVDDILRDDPFTGIGKPEPLRNTADGAWSRRIDTTNRLVYVVTDEFVIIQQARHHY